MTTALRERRGKAPNPPKLHRSIAQAQGTERAYRNLSDPNERVETNPSAQGQTTRPLQSMANWAGKYAGLNINVLKKNISKKKMFQTVGKKCTEQNNFNYGHFLVLIPYDFLNLFLPGPWHLLLPQWHPRLGRHPEPVLRRPKRKLEQKQIRPAVCWREALSSKLGC